MEARRPRFEAGGAQRRRATERFLAAVVGGDVDRLLEATRPGRRAVDRRRRQGPGGAARHHGADKVGRWIAGIMGKPYQGVDPADMRMRRVDLNGEPALVVDGPDRPLSTITLDFDDQGLVRAIHVVANPDKLRALAVGRRLPM